MNAEQVTALAEEIAGYMGDDWHHEPYDEADGGPSDWRFRIMHITDIEFGIHVNCRQKPGYLVISGMWPSETFLDGRRSQITPYNVSLTSPTINVRADRPPVDIMREIHRRLIPNYTATFEACERHAREGNKYREGKARSARHLAAILADAADIRGDDLDHVHVKTFGTFRTMGDERVEVNVTVPIKVAAAIAALLKTETS